jgi:hypothetical protein
VSYYLARRASNLAGAEFGRGQEMQKPADLPMATWIERNRTTAGGWSRTFIESLGLTWPPPKHWKRNLERGRLIGRDNSIAATKTKRTRSPDGPNEAERQFKLWAEGNGWEITKRGWPDFICFQDGRAMFVEVKRNKRISLKKSQRTIISILSEAGCDCFKWTPDGGLTKL